MEGEGEEGPLFGAKGLGADGVHAHRQAFQDGVGGDVGEAQAQGAPGELHFALASKEDDGHGGARVHH